MEVTCSWNPQVCSSRLFPFLLRRAVKLGTKISLMRMPSWINISSFSLNFQTKKFPSLDRFLLCLLCFPLFLSTRGRRSLQVLILLFNSCLLLLSLLVCLVCFCLFVWAEFSLLGYSAATVEIQLGRSFILTVVGVFVHVNRMVGWCGLSQSGSRFWKSELSHQLFFFIYLRRCRTVSVGRMLRQYYLKNVQNLTYLVYFFSKT